MKPTVLRQVSEIASCISTGLLVLGACTDGVTPGPVDAGRTADSGAKRDAGATIVPDSGLRDCASGGCVDVAASSGYDPARAKIAAVLGPVRRRRPAIFLATATPETAGPQ